MSSIANPDIAHYRWADDDNASHELCAFIADEDTSYEVPLADRGTSHLLVVKIHNDGDMAANGDFQLQYEKNSTGGFSDVNATSSNVRTIAGQDTDNATSSTERLTATAQTFVFSTFEDGDSLNAKNIGGGDDCEYYYSIEFRTADNSGGESYEFRVLHGGATMTHDVAINATLAAGALTISGTVGEIASGEVFEADNVLANVSQVILGTVGEIASGEAFESNNAVAFAARLAITGTVGEITSGEAFEADNAVSDVVLAITGTTGAIASGEAFETDNQIKGINPTVEAAGAIVSGEAFEANNTVAFATRLVITGTVGEIASGEAFEADNEVSDVVLEVTGTVGEIASGEAFEADNVVAVVGLAITGTAGEIATGEAFEADNKVAFPAQQIGPAGNIASGATFETDNRITERLLISGAVGAIASGESFESNNVIGPFVETSGSLTKASIRMGFRM